MGIIHCMNELCCKRDMSEWKKGWTLNSGGNAILCLNCETAYTSKVYCLAFHTKESGWRECKICGKRIHCGCIASRDLFEYMDLGGVACISCAIHPVQSMQISVDIPNDTFVTNSSIRDFQSEIIEKKIDNDKFSTERLLELSNAIRANDVNSMLALLKHEEPMLKTEESSKCFPKQEDIHEFLKSSLNSSSPRVLPFPVGIVKESEQNKGSLAQGQKTHHIMPKPSKPNPVVDPETNKGTFSQTRVARPPPEECGRYRLLPQHWPRITDQELQQLSRGLKSTIVPLFEKILSASDASKAGRLVLPKACAEAYFPYIVQPEGIPIKIQDIKGREWTFQFRFWPNNNSRMYVLEGVAPCIQNMRLQAGDTVIFSRIDPGGQLVVSCRKATNNFDVQYSNDDSSSNVLPRPRTISEKKKVKNIKNKRHLMPHEDAMEMRITRDEAQELFRPFPASEPTAVMIEDYEFEEFEEPPVFGKRTIFTYRPSGEQVQLAQCDSCLKWRTLPLHALLSSKWTCSENIWDSNRSSCSAASEDIIPRDLDSYFRTKESERRGISVNKSLKEGGELNESSVGPTTKHPRHHPGCTCIVCNHPSSEQGKHEPTCICNVCLAVRRRFNTQMMHTKLKRILERETEVAQEKSENFWGDSLLSINHNGTELDLEETDKGELDLNCDPHREDDILALMNAFDVLMKQNEVQSLKSCLVTRIVAGSEENVADEGGVLTGNIG